MEIEARPINLEAGPVGNGRALAIALVEGLETVLEADWAVTIDLVLAIALEAD